MRYSLTKEVRQVFYRNGVVTLSELVTLPEELPSCSATREDALLKEGWDIHRREPALAALCKKRPPLEILSELTGKKPLRLLYSYYFKEVLPRDTNPFFHNSYPLSLTSSFQGTVGAISFDLDTGDCSFYTVEHNIDFSKFTKRSMNSLFVVYGTKDALFRKGEQDLHAPYFRSLGYEYGDTLSDELNPIVYR